MYTPVWSSTPGYQTNLSMLGYVQILEKQSFYND